MSAIVHLARSGPHPPSSDARLDRGRPGLRWQRDAAGDESLRILELHPRSAVHDDAARSFRPTCTHRVHRFRIHNEGIVSH